MQLESIEKEILTHLIFPHLSKTKHFLGRWNIKINVSVQTFHLSLNVFTLTYYHYYQYGFLVVAYAYLNSCHVFHPLQRGKFFPIVVSPTFFLLIAFAFSPTRLDGFTGLRGRGAFSDNCL